MRPPIRCHWEVAEHVLARPGARAGAVHRYAVLVNQSRPDESHGLSHLNARGQARMVDVSAKPASVRIARAEATFRLDPAVRELLLAGNLDKGEALAVARVAGIQAAKETSRLIPLCHPLALHYVSIEFEAEGEDAVLIRAEASTTGPTGVEMEALTAVSVAGLTLYDMAKSRCRTAQIERVRLIHKSGGKSGTWDRDSDGGQVGDRDRQE